MRKAKGFDAYLRFIVDYPHDYQMRFERAQSLADGEQPSRAVKEAADVLSGLTAYDHFLLMVYFTCFNPLAMEAGLSRELMDAMGIPAMTMLHLMPAMSQMHAAVCEVRNALQMVSK